MAKGSLRQILVKVKVDGEQVKGVVVQSKTLGQRRPLPSAYLKAAGDAGFTGENPRLVIAEFSLILFGKKVKSGKMKAIGHKIAIEMIHAEHSKRNAMWEEFESFIRDKGLAYEADDYQGHYWRRWVYTGPAEADSGLETCEDAKAVDCFLKTKELHICRIMPQMGLVYEMW
ncbi:hypothetical protein E4U53_006150 [Claviceps sorghi]|nr:hypothetical protein E4U53_006150 [Claviceps sorghi]